MSAHGYEAEFEEELDVWEFWSWLETNAETFMHNIENGTLKYPKDNPILVKPLHLWIGLFLMWTEYEDYMDSQRKEIEENQ